MITRTLLQLPYRAARTPLTLFDTALVRRLPKESAPRLTFERILGSIDEIAGRLLDNDGIEQRGTKLRERAEKLGHAMELEQQAASRRNAAGDTLRSAKEKAGALHDEAQQRTREGLRAAADTERKGKQTAAKRADELADTAKERVDQAAADRLAAVEHDRNQTEKQAAAREERATEKAKEDLHQVAQQRTDAAERRADADQLSELVDAKKDSRQNS
jgi:hypothetical protein